MILFKRFVCKFALGLLLVWDYWCFVVIVGWIFVLDLFLCFLGLEGGVWFTMSWGFVVNVGWLRLLICDLLLLLWCFKVTRC